MASEPPKVFISYSHDSQEHAQHVLELAERLRSDGMDAWIDQYVAGSPKEGWPRWMLNRLDWAEFVLVVCTKTYYRRFRGFEEQGKGKGADWEGNLITAEIYNAKSTTTKFVPVFFETQDDQFIPEPFSTSTRYLLSSEHNYHNLYTFLTGHAGVRPRTLGSLKTFALKPVEPLRFESSKAELHGVPDLPPHYLPREEVLAVLKAELHGVPDLPPHYLPREEVLAVLKQKLLAEGATPGSTGKSSAVGVQGMGGIGKTVLASALAHDSEVRQAFPDGIYWVTVGQKPSLLDLQNQLLRQLTGSKETLATQQEAKDALREALEGRSALVVLDDVWTIDHADAFSVTALPARLIITTRNNEVLVGLGAEEHSMEVLSPSDALKMLAEWVDQKSPDTLPVEAAEVAKECGYLPLALAMIGAMIRSKPSSGPASASLAWKDALTRLRRADLGALKKAFPNYPWPDLLQAIEVSVEGLESADRERYLDMAVFPEDVPIPEGPLRILWNTDEIDTRDCMARFVVRSLVKWATDGSSLILHDLLRDLIHKRREKDLHGLHLRLVEAWDALPKLPDAYAWRWIAYHLVEAGREDDLRRLLVDFNYLKTKLAATSLNALIADYSYLTDDKESPSVTTKSAAQLVGEALRLSAPALAPDPGELPGQLHGRLLGFVAQPDIRKLLDQAAESRDGVWLKPLTANLVPPGSPLIAKLTERDKTVTAVAFSSDGGTVVFASRDRDQGSGPDSDVCDVKVWSVSSGAVVTLCRSRVDALTLSPDGAHVAIATGGTGTLWPIAARSGRFPQSFSGLPDPFVALSFSEGGKSLVAVSKGGEVQTWDMTQSPPKLAALERSQSGLPRARRFRFLGF